jgi:hypothetical protein
LNDFPPGAFEGKAFLPLCGVTFWVGRQVVFFLLRRGGLFMLWSSPLRHSET